MQSGLTSALATLRAQLDSAPWLRWALLVIAALASFFLLQALEEARTKAQNESIEQEAKLRQVRALQGQDVWLARAQESQELLDAMQAQIPVAATPGAAQAALQSWLGGLGNAIADSESVRISVDNAAALEEIPGVLRIRATLRAGMSAREAINIIRQIEGAPSLVVIDSLDLRSDANRVVAIGLNAYYRTAEGPRTEPLP